MSLIQIQEDAVRSILALSENGKRAMGYGLTFLNKRGRGIAAVRRRYFAASITLGFTEAQCASQWQDVKDHAQLCHVTEEA